MADPSSIVGSVVDVVAGSVVLASGLHDVIQRFGIEMSDAEGIISLAGELSYFSIVLDELRKILDVPASEPVASDQLLGSIAQAMDMCKTMFKDVSWMIGQVANGERRGSEDFRMRLNWIFGDGRVKVLKAMLVSLKATLGLMLQTLRFATSDQSDPIQRALLQNMLKTQQHGVKLLQCTELEETRSGLPTLSSKTATLMQRTIALLSNTLLLTGDPQRTRAADAPTLSTDHPPVLNELDRNSEFRPFDADFKYPVDDGGKRGSIGSAVPRSQKEGGLDTMLSKWINPPEYHSQDGHLVAPSYDSLPIQDVSPLSSLGVQSGYFANPTEEFSSEVAIIQELQEERQGLQEDICRYRSHANKLRMNEYHKRLKDSEDMMKILIEGKDKEQEHDRFEIEKELKQCDTRQERQKSLEKELERCREDYRIQVLEQPDQSHKTLKRQIQSMEGHLEHYSAENASLAEIRQESQRRMKTMQMYYKTFVAKCKDDHNATAKELEGSRSLLPYPGQEELERKIAEVEQELTVLGGQLQTQNSGQVLLPNKFTLESSVPSTNKTPQQRNSYRQPRPLNGPVWLDSESGEPDGVLKEESAGNGYSDKIVVDGSEPKTDSRGWGGGSNQTAGYPTNDHAAHVHPHPSSLLHPSWSSSSRDSVPTSPPSYSSGGSRRQHSTSSSTTTSSSPSTHRYSANIDSDSTSASQKLAKRNMWARFGSGRN